MDMIHRHQMRMGVGNMYPGKRHRDALNAILSLHRPRDPLRDLNHAARKFGGHILKPDMVRARNDKGVAGMDREDIKKRHNLIVLMQDMRGLLARRYGAKQAG